MGFNTCEVGSGVPCSHKCTLLVVGALLTQNITWKTNQLVVYASRLLNIGKQNYSTTEREALAMVLHCICFDIICWEICLCFM
jgi:predicted transglutaminase-like protease